MSQCLIGFFLLMVIMVLKDHGGSALTVMRYSIQPRCARAKTVIRSLGIAGSADDVPLLSDVRRAYAMLGFNKSQRRI